MQLRDCLLVGIAATLAGCSDGGGGKGGTDSGVDARDIDAAAPTGSLATTWSTVTAATDGTAVVADCPTNAAAIVYIQATSSSDAPRELHFLCWDKAGMATKIAPGSYTVWVRLTDAGFSTRYAESAPVTVHVTANQVTTVPQFEIFVDHAFFRVGWNLRPPGSSGPVACSTVSGENGMVITAADGGGGLFETRVDCEAGTAPLTVRTRPLPLGSAYSVTLTLVDGTDAPLATAPVIVVPAGTLDYGSEVHDLGVVEITDGWQ